MARRSSAVRSPRASRSGAASIATSGSTIRDSREFTLELALEGDGWVVIDLNSRNGTFVNNKQILQRHALTHRDVISIGRAKIKFHAYGYHPPRPADPTEATLMPAKTRAAIEARQPTPHYQAQRPLPTPVPRDTGGDSTITQSPGDTIADRPLAFTRPPARPIVKPTDDEA